MPARRVTINGIEQIDPRNTYAWRKLRDRVVREEPVCRLRLPVVCTTLSTTADHIKPVATYPELALERTNLRGACRACNDARRSTPDEAMRIGGVGEVTRPALAVFGDSDKDGDR